LLIQVLLIVIAAAASYPCYRRAAERQTGDLHDLSSSLCPPNRAVEREAQTGI